MTPLFPALWPAFAWFACRPWLSIHRSAAKGHHIVTRTGCPLRRLRAPFHLLKECPLYNCRVCGFRISQQAGQFRQGLRFPRRRVRWCRLTCRGAPGQTPRMHSVESMVCFLCSGKCLTDGRAFLAPGYLRTSCKETPNVLASARNRCQFVNAPPAK